MLVDEAEDAYVDRRPSEGEAAPDVLLKCDFPKKSQFPILPKKIKMSSRKSSFQKPIKKLQNPASIPDR